MNEGVLAGIRVLDFGRFIAGPFCGALLADHGAEVIRIESTKRVDRLRILPPFRDKELWRVSLPSTADLLAVPGEPLIDCGGALRWHADPPPEVPIRELTQRAGGTALLWQGSAGQSRFHPLAPSSGRRMR